MALSDYIPRGKEEPPKMAPLPIPGHRTRSMSDAAAAAAQHVFDLEQEITNLQNSVKEWEHRALASEAACRNLHDELAHVKDERDHFQRRAIEIMTKLECSAKIILDAMNTNKSLRGEAETLAGVEKAITETPNDPPTS